MRNMKREKSGKRGFTLLESMISVLLILIVVGGIFRQMQKAQASYRVEGQKIDLTQQQREFIDQFTRDLHQAGYPDPRSFGTQIANLGDTRISAGITAISPTSITVEGDLDNTGQVQVVTYTYNNSTTFPCPCIQRQVANKGGAVLGTYVEVQNLLDPGAAGIFTAYKANGVPWAANLTLPAAAPLNDPTYSQLRQIKSVRVTFTLQGLGRELNGKTPIQVTMTGMARLPNND
jgi:prepilin-type N-terminal cleavage/methylation domain-containing protein